MNYARRVRPFSTMVRSLGFRRDLALRLMAPDRCKPRFSGSRRTSSAPDDVELATGVDIARSFEGLRSDRIASDEQRGTLNQLQDRLHPGLSKQERPAADERERTRIGQAESENAERRPGWLLTFSHAMGIPVNCAYVQNRRGGPRRCPLSIYRSCWSGRRFLSTMATVCSRQYVALSLPCTATAASGCTRYEAARLRREY